MCSSDVILRWNSLIPSIRFFKWITMTVLISLKNAVSTKIKNCEGELEGK